MLLYIIFETPRKRPNEPLASAIGATYGLFLSESCDTQGVKK